MESTNLLKDNSYKLKNELRLQRRAGIKVKLDYDEPQWWVEEFITFVHDIAPAKQLGAAKSYVKSGKVLEMNIKPGVVEAKVQGQRKSPYLVRLYSPLPTDEHLIDLKRGFSERAIYGALLLAGEMPIEVRDLFAESGVALMPNEYRKKQLLCSCPEPETICKHIVAVLYVLIGAFDRDPFLLLRMRGLYKDDLLESLAEPRGVDVTPCAHHHDAEPQAETPPTAPATACFGLGGRGVMKSPLDVSFYGDENLHELLEAFQGDTHERAEDFGTHPPLFNFPLWRGETSFKDSIYPYYESVRKMLKNK